MYYNTKKILIISIISTVAIQFLIYIFILRDSVKEIIILNKNIESQNLVYQNILENYINIEENKYLLTVMQKENMNEIVDISKLPHAIIKTSNLMAENNIKEDTFNIGNIQLVDYIESIDGFYDQISLLPIHISGVGTYNNIMNYLKGLNSTTNPYLIDNIKIIQTLEEEFYYLDTNILIVVGSNYE